MNIIVKRDLTNDNSSEFIEIPLDPTEVKAAKQIITNFFASVKKQSVDNHMPTLYYHVLLLSHIQSEKYLAALGTENLAEIMQKFGKK